MSKMYLKCPNIYGIHIHVYPILDNILNTKVFICYNSLHASREFCRLPIAIASANSLNPDEDQQNIGLDLDPNCLTLR